jgi:(p)ppGpp synthase/HD superfamily hydrolase
MENIVSAFFLSKKSRSLVETASLIAYVTHQGQVRKDDHSPYFIHPCQVALKLMRYGFGESIVAAGFVHDVLEDTAFPQSELERLLGKEVVDIVLAVSENKALPWEERKKHYINQVIQASDAAKAVSIADKVHNLESLLASCTVHGPDVWRVFNQGKEQKIWFERAMCEAMQAVWKHPLLDEYAVLVKRLDNVE